MADTETQPSHSHRRPSVDIISLGCSKNLVDSERLMAMLADVGYDVRMIGSAEQARADVAVINTCGFIGDAKEESVNEILALTAAKADGRISELFVMGCLSQRYREILPAEIPEVDGWWGKTDWHGIVATLARRSPATAPYDRVITTPRHHAYLKIAEGCNRFCAFCAIPLITGRLNSRPADEIIDEVKMLVARGVKEFNIIAQDLTGYGRDITPDGSSTIAALVDRISRVDGVSWIRLHYAYPADFPLDLLDVMAARPNVCRYLDIALQHAADPVLKNMRRHITLEQTRALLDEIRRRVPGIHIRTTLMVGFPGEDDDAFNTLLDFVAEQRFERMGAFAYCEEDDTFAARHLVDNVPPEVKQQRLDTLMALQEEISADIQQQKIGSVIKVIIDREEPEFYVGRSQFDSPEVDPEVLIDKKVRPLAIGSFVDVRVTDALPYELIATPVNE